MNKEDYKEIFNSDIGALFPKHKKKLRKIGKNDIIPKLSPKEHSLFIQKPSLFRKLPQLIKPDLSIFQDILERSLSTARENKSQNIKTISRETLGKGKRKDNINAKISNKEDYGIKYTMFRRFMSKKPLKNTQTRVKHPVFSEKSLMILKYNSRLHLLTNVNTENSSITKRRINSGTDSDEDKMDYKLDNSIYN